MDKEKWGVHETHCCVLHGCKYGDDDCPVVNKLTKQKYICEQCEEDGISEVEDIDMIFDAVETLQNHTQYYIPTSDLPALNMAVDALKHRYGLVD